MKYSDQLVKSYLLGEEILDYDIDELEDDPEFMLKAIKISKDFKLYDLCGEAVKRNFLVVKTLIEMFKENEELITKVGSYYLKKSSPDLENVNRAIISLLIKKNLKDEDSDLFLESSLICEAFYLDRRNEYESVVEKAKTKTKNELGLGYIIVLTEYPMNDLIKEFMAKRMLEDIFEKRVDFCLENYLHSNYEKETILKQGIRTILLNYIRLFDSHLVRYIESHINLLAIYRKRVLYILERWDYFKTNQEEEIVDNILEEIDHFCDENMMETSFKDIDVINYIIKEFNLLEIFQKYDPNFVLIADELPKAQVLNSHTLKKEEYIRLLQLRSRINYYLNSGDVADAYLLNNKGKILNLEKKKAKKEPKKEN